MIKGTYTREFYILPTILYYNEVCSYGMYKTVEFAWLKYYIGFSW